VAERLQIYKCEKCGNIVEVLYGGQGELSCCDEPMKLFVENTVDAAREKHIPVIEKIAGGFKVKIGSVPRGAGHSQGVLQSAWSVESVTREIPI